MPNIAYAAEQGELSIHLAPEVIGYIFNLPVTNTLIMVWFVALVLVAMAVIVRRNLREVPGKFQLVLEELIGYVHGYVEETLGDKVLAKKVFPLVITIFVFVLGANWIGLLPGVDSIGLYQEVHGETKLTGFLHPANTDLNVTLAISLIAFLAIEILGVSMLGALTYAKKFFNFKSPLAFMVGIIELFSEFARLISFAFRLFGNIFAGKTLILVAIFFLPYIVPVPLLAFEVFVGFIQAFIFAILTLFFIKLAVEEPH